jgi:hypothetical protein
MKQKQEYMRKLLTTAFAKVIRYTQKLKKIRDRRSTLNLMFPAHIDVCHTVPHSSHLSRTLNAQHKWGLSHTQQPLAGIQVCEIHATYHYGHLHIIRAEHSGWPWLHLQKETINTVGLQDPSALSHINENTLCLP